MIQSAKNEVFGYFLDYVCWNYLIVSVLVGVPAVKALLQPIQLQHIHSHSSLIYNTRRTVHLRPSGSCDCNILLHLGKFQDLEHSKRLFPRKGRSITLT